MILEVIIAGLSFFVGIQLLRIALATTFQLTIKNSQFIKALIISLGKVVIAVSIIFFILFNEFLRGTIFIDLFSLFIIIQSFFLLVYVFFPMKHITSIKVTQRLFKPNFLFAFGKK